MLFFPTLRCDPGHTRLVQARLFAGTLRSNAPLLGAQRNIRDSGRLKLRTLGTKEGINFEEV